MREPSNRPPGRSSSGEVEAGGHGSGRTRRNGPPRVDKRALKRGEHSESQSSDETILGILRPSVKFVKLSDHMVGLVHKHHIINEI